MPSFCKSLNTQRRGSEILINFYLIQYIQSFYFK